MEQLKKTLLQLATCIPKTENRVQNNLKVEEKRRLVGGGRCSMCLPGVSGTSGGSRAVYATPPSTNLARSSNASTSCSALTRGCLLPYPLPRPPLRWRKAGELSCKPVFVKILLRASEVERWGICSEVPSKEGTAGRLVGVPSTAFSTTIGWSFHHKQPSGGEQRGLSFFKFGVKLFFSWLNHRIHCQSCHQSSKYIFIALID